MGLVELHQLLCSLVARERERAANGARKVGGHAHDPVASAAVHALVIGLELVPELLQLVHGVLTVALLGEDRADSHDDREVVHHVAAQLGRGDVVVDVVGVHHDARHAPVVVHAAREDLVVDGINITASIPGDNTADSSAERLEPGTSYELKVCTETSESDVVTVSTCTPDQLYNMGFDDWYSVMSGSYDIWYPNINDSYNVWGTANPGSGNFVGSLTTPTDIVAVPGEGKRAARLESKTAVIAFAAGNIFTGQFGRINGLGAILDWGTPFSGKPCALKGYYAYTPQVIKNAKGEYAGLQNTVDKCQLLVILTDWDTPFTVNTTDGIFVDQTPANPNIIAYGKIEDDKDTFSDPEADDNGYIPFTLELEWWRPEAVPTYAVVIACASYKGDYFIGGEGSLMFVDEFEFVYD